jgi:two-component system sensor histidine kinase KdpD
MACLSSDPEVGEELLRKAAHNAEHMNAEWYAVHVETSGESVQKISAADLQALLDNISLAANLGANTVWLKSGDVVKALLDFAHEHKINRIIIGRPQPTLINRLLRWSTANQIIAAASDFDIELIGHERTSEVNDSAGTALADS